MMLRLEKIPAPPKGSRLIDFKANLNVKTVGQFLGLIEYGYGKILFCSDAVFLEKTLQNDAPELREWQFSLREIFNAPEGAPFIRWSERSALDQNDFFDGKIILFEPTSEEDIDALREIVENDGANVMFLVPSSANLLITAKIFVIWRVEKSRKQVNESFPTGWILTSTLSSDCRQNLPTILAESKATARSEIVKRELLSEWQFLFTNQLFQQFVFNEVFHVRGERVDHFTFWNNKKWINVELEAPASEKIVSNAYAKFCQYHGFGDSTKHNIVHRILTILGPRIILPVVKTRPLEKNFEKKRGVFLYRDNPPFKLYFDQENFNLFYKNALKNETVNIKKLADAMTIYAYFGENFNGIATTDLKKIVPMPIGSYKITVGGPENVQNLARVYAHKNFPQDVWQKFFDHEKKPLDGTRRPVAFAKYFENPFKLGTFIETTATDFNRVPFRAFYSITATLLDPSKNYKESATTFLTDLDDVLAERLAMFFEVGTGNLANQSGNRQYIFLPKDSVVQQYVHPLRAARLPKPMSFSQNKTLEVVPPPKIRDIWCREDELKKLFSFQEQTLYAAFIGHSGNISENIIVHLWLLDKIEARKKFTLHVVTMNQTNSNFSYGEMRSLLMPDVLERKDFPLGVERAACFSSKFSMGPGDNYKMFIQKVYRGSILFFAISSDEDAPKSGLRFEFFFS